MSSELEDVFGSMLVGKVLYLKISIHVYFLIFYRVTDFALHKRIPCKHLIFLSGPSYVGGEIISFSKASGKLH